VRNRLIGLAKATPSGVAFAERSAKNVRATIGDEAMDTTLEILDDAEEDLMARSFLYVHPGSFREGVEATMEAVKVLLARMSRVAASPIPTHSPVV
jgi:hypothetical protein